MILQKRSRTEDRNLRSSWFGGFYFPRASGKWLENSAAFWPLCGAAPTNSTYFCPSTGKEMAGRKYSWSNLQNIIFPLHIWPDIESSYLGYSRCSGIPLFGLRALGFSVFLTKAAVKRVMKRRRFADAQCE
jgi:hypothetical protein